MTSTRNARQKRGQGAFEFLLLATGAVLFVVLAVAVVRTSLNTNANNANNTAGGYQDYTVFQGATLGPDGVQANCVARWAFDNNAPGENSTYVVDLKRG